MFQGLRTRKINVRKAKQKRNIHMHAEIVWRVYPIRAYDSECPEECGCAKNAEDGAFDVQNKKYLPLKVDYQC
jgi:hypothetical protein